MSSEYEGLSARDADDIMSGQISCIVCDVLDEARRMTAKQLRNRDIFEWSDHVAGMIAVAIENRRRGAP